MKHNSLSGVEGGIDLFLFGHLICEVIMIVYSASKAQFHRDIFDNQIDDKIQVLLNQRLNKKVAPNEIRSWQSSLRHMDTILLHSSVPDDASVAIEYNIPLTAKRVDFLICGRGQDRKGNVVIVELKQWENIETTVKDATVRTFLGGNQRETAHPSYQAWTYSQLIADYNQTVQDLDIGLHPCAYLHNSNDEKLRDPFYQAHFDKAPVFLKTDSANLRDFIAKHIRYGDPNGLIEQIEGGRIRPSKKLADTLEGMLAGKSEFLMIDEQKLVCENVLFHANQLNLSDFKKKVLIVEGGPGTGKTVVAINLLAQLTRKQLLAQYVTKNSAPREVYQSKLTGTYKKTFLSNLFRGSGVFYDCDENQFDVLLVDEAHRLNAKSGMFSHLGDNQIKEIIHASKISVFFVDDNQVVTSKDIGQVQEILDWAKTLNVSVERYELASQFRCNGSDAYLAWLDHTLDIRPTANFELDGSEIDFRVFDTASELRQAIELKNIEKNSARIVAGYCWNWDSKKDPSKFDLVLDEGSFAMRWNLADDGMLWILKQDSVQEVGCIHTCQGLELDYIGVIFGPDLIVREGNVVIQPEKRAKTDKSLHGWKNKFSKDPIKTKQWVDRLIKNTYKTLMTRGQKGCFIYSVDAETNDYFKECVSNIKLNDVSKETPWHSNHGFEVLGKGICAPNKKSLPILNVLSNTLLIPTPNETTEWIALPEWFNPSEDMFVCQQMSDGMGNKIPVGQWMVLRRTKNMISEKIYLVNHVHINEYPWPTGWATRQFFKYESMSAKNWSEPSFELRSLSPFGKYESIFVQGDVSDQIAHFAEFVMILPEIF